jgi:hypothetical protein
MVSNLNLIPQQFKRILIFCFVLIDDRIDFFYLDLIPRHFKRILLFGFNSMKDRLNCF